VFSGKDAKLGFASVTVRAADLGAQPKEQWCVVEVYHLLVCIAHFAQGWRFASMSVVEPRDSFLGVLGTEEEVSSRVLWQ
jgi:hypothetical protein